MSATIAWRGAVAAPIRIHDPNRRARRCWFARSPNLVNVTRGGGMPGPGMGWSVRSVTRASRVHRVASPRRASMSMCRGKRVRVDSMIERGRTPSTTRDDGQKPEDGQGEDSETQPPGDDLNPDELEDDDYVYVGDDWNDVGPSLAPSIVTACLGAFLFGYHSAVINAPLADIAEDLGFAGDNVAKGAIVSIMVVGGFAGGLGIGPFSDKEGRRAALVATTVPLALGTLICGGANSFWTMMLGRFVTGAGVGASTQIVPVYLSEVSPPGLRGTVNGIRRMGYVVGCLMAFQLCGPLKDANMPDGYVKPVRMNGAGVDTYIDAVQSKGKFAVVAEKVKETAAAAGKDVVVRVESKVEKLEEKLKVATEKDSSLTSGSIPSSISSSTSTDRAAGALAATSADAKAAPAVKLATTERPSMTVSSTVTSTEVKPATGKAGTEMGEKPEKAEKKAEPGKLPEASTAAAAPTKPPPESPSPPASTEPPKPMADAVKKSSTETSPAKESPPISTSTSATEAKKPTTSPGASKAEAQKTADAAAIAAYETATTSQLAPKPTADVASTKAAAAAVAKTVSKESNSQGGVVSKESVAAVEAVVQMPTATSFVELKAIVKDAAAVDAAVLSTVKSTEAKPEAKPGGGAEIEKKEKALLTEKPAVKSEDKPAIVSEKETVKETVVVAKDVASNAVPVVAKDASKDVVAKDVVAKDVVSKDVAKEVVSKESKPSVDDAAAVKKDSPDASSTKKDPPAGVSTGSALKKEKVDLEEKAAARIEEKSSKKTSGDASTSPKPTTTIPPTSASTATSKDKGAKGNTSTTTTSTSTSTPTTVESAKKAAAIKGGPPEVIRAEPGWWRPLFYVAAIPAVAQAAGALSGVAVESPVWLLGPEGCAMESRRSLAKLLGIRGRAAVRWQEAVAGSGVVIGMGKQGRVFKTVDEEEDEEGELDEDGNLCVTCSFDPDESEAAVNSWGALFTEQRNRYPMIIGAGVCLLAGLSGSNTVIYYASSVLKEAGVDDPGLLTLVVGLPNVLGGVIALLCTDKYGRRPLLLWSFGGMAVCLAAFSTAAFATPGNPVNNTFCALATPVTSGGLQEGGEFVGDAMAAICDDLAAYTTATVTQRSFEPLRTTTLVAIPLYTFFFSMGAGPVPWLLYSEVFPTRIRSRATAVVTAINYSCNTIVGASFLPLIGAFGLKGTYAMYAVLCAVGYVFVDNLVFETKGLALQDIEGVMLTKEAQWSGRELASSEEDGDAYGQTGAGEDANEDSALGSGFWWTEVGEKMEKVIGDVRRSMDELATAEVEEEAAASIEDDEETIDVDVK